VRIGVVSQWYPPEPGFIPASLASELATRGHSVRVLTGYPNYPDGRLYPGYRQRLSDVTTDGMLALRRVPLYPSHDTSALRRAGNYLSFAAASALAAPRHLGGVDAVYVYHPPATAYAPAALLWLLRRVPAVLHVQDVWPESVTGSSMVRGRRTGRLLGSALGRLMRLIYRSAAGIAVIAPSMRDLVTARGADSDVVRVVLNWTDEELFRAVPPTSSARAAIGHRGRCTVMYAGNIGPFQDLEVAVRAAARTGSAVDLVIAGSGIHESSVRELASSLGADNVRFLGRRQPEEMAELSAAADFQLVTLRDLPAMRRIIPSKLQSALACSCPVIVSAAGDCAELVVEQRVGFVSPPGDVDALASVFTTAAALPEAERAAMGHRAGQAYRALMSRRAGVDALEDMLSRATSPFTWRRPAGFRLEEAASRLGQRV
jgi:glycosyltransferase involved in cell wall biosynthesis